MLKSDALIINYYTFELEKNSVDRNSNKIIKELRFELCENMEGISDSSDDKINLENRLHGRIVSELILELSLKIERLQKNNIERLSISIFDKNTELYREGIYCNMLNIDTAIKDLILMGTGLMKSDVHKLVSIIQKNYRFIEPKDDDRDKNLLDAHWNSILQMFNNIIYETDNNENNQNNHKEYLYIPVKDFNDYIETSKFAKLGNSAIREKLNQQGLTKCNTNRNDYTLLDNGKTCKVICLIKDNIRKACKEE